MEISTSKEKSTRIFLALPVSKIYHADIGCLQSDLKMDLTHLPHSVRWTQPHRLHLTLFFLGRHFYDEITHLIYCMKKMRFSHLLSKPELYCDQVQLFPELRPTVIALTGKASPSLIYLRHEIESCLEKAQVYPDLSHETHGFLPHITLGKLEEPTDLKAQPVDINVSFNQLILYKSEPIEPRRSPYVTHTALYTQSIGDFR